MALRVFLIIFCLLLVNGRAFGATDYRVSEYKLDVSFEPTEAAMTGHATVYFEPWTSPPDSLVGYLHGELHVDSILIGGKSVPYHVDKVLYQYEYSLVARRFAVARPLPSGVKIDIYYSGWCNPSRAGSISNYMRIDDSGVYLRAYGYSLWFPIFQEASQDTYPILFSSVTINVPSDYRAVFVGERVADEIKGERCLSTWRAEGYDIFAAQCTARRFDEISENNLHIYHLKDEAATVAAKSILSFAQRLTDRYSELYGAAHESGLLHIMQMPKYGNISGGNVIGISDDIWTQFNEETYPQRTLAHELVHSFVRPNIERGEKLYSLVIEGFPCYFHLPVLGEILGQEWYDEYMVSVEDRYLKQKQTGLDRRGNPLPVEKPIDEITPDEIGDYKDYFILSDRALLFLNFLKMKMGEETFAAFVKDLCSRESLTDEDFYSLADRFYPDDPKDIYTWLSTNEYPEKWHLSESSGQK